MRVRPLDLLRALAVLLVLGRHTPPPEPGVVAPLRVLGKIWYESGWIGVDLFFVLSGFLISGLFFREFRRHGDVRVWRFLVRRGFKIYPPFYAMLLATLIYYHFPGGKVGELLRNEAIFLQNYWGGIWNHTWSLDAEEHFYLVLGALVAVLVWVGRARKDPFRPLVYLMPLAAAAVVGLRVWSRWDPGVIHLYLTHMRADGLAWGVFLGYWYHCRDRRWLGVLHRHVLLVLLAAAVLLAPPFVWWFSEHTPLWTIGLASMALGFTAVLSLALPAGDGAPRAPWRAERALARIGADSYSIYLWHMPVSRWLMPTIDDAGLFAVGGPTASYALRSATFLGICVAGGIIAAFLVERPALALRDWPCPSRSGALPIGPA